MDSLCCRAEANTTLKINYPPLRINFEKTKKKKCVFTATEQAKTGLFPKSSLDGFTVHRAPWPGGGLLVSFVFFLGLFWLCDLKKQGKKEVNFYSDWKTFSSSSGDHSLLLPEARLPSVHIALPYQRRPGGPGGSSLLHGVSRCSERGLLSSWSARAALCGRLSWEHVLWGTCAPGAAAGGLSTQGSGL